MFYFQCFSAFFLFSLLFILLFNYCSTCKSLKINSTHKPENIYRRVLEIGSENILCGISFNEMYSILEKEGFVFDEGKCLERCLREWFWNSFFHEEAHCEKGEMDNVTKLDEHIDCKFTLRAESCMKILTFKESENNVKISTNSNRIAMIGLVISIIGLAVSLLKDDSEKLNNIINNQNKQMKKVLEKIDKSLIDDNKNNTQVIIELN